MTIGEKVRQLRLQNFMTQRQLAATIGVCQITVCIWECGRKKPQLSNLKKLCEAFGISPQELLRDVEI